MYLYTLYFWRCFMNHTVFLLICFQISTWDYQITLIFGNIANTIKKMDVWVLIFICSIAFIVKERERESFKNLYLLFPYYLVYWEHEHQSHLPMTLFLTNSIFLANAPTHDLMKYHYWVTSLFQLPSLLANWS